MRTKRNVTIRCTKRCEKGRPERGYLCQCTACNGRLHGAVTISLRHLTELVDRKLLDPTLSQAEFERWMRVMDSLMTGPTRLRRVG